MGDLLRILLPHRQFSLPSLTVSDREPKEINRADHGQWLRSWRPALPPRHRLHAFSERQPRSSRLTDSALTAGPVQSTVCQTHPKP